MLIGLLLNNIFIIFYIKMVLFRNFISDTISYAAFFLINRTYFM